LDIINHIQEFRDIVAVIVSDFQLCDSAISGFTAALTQKVLLNIIKATIKRCHTAALESLGQRIRAAIQRFRHGSGDFHA